MTTSDKIQKLAPVIVIGAPDNEKAQLVKTKSAELIQAVKDLATIEVSESTVEDARKKYAAMKKVAKEVNKARLDAFKPSREAEKKAQQACKAFLDGIAAIVKPFDDKIAAVLKEQERKRVEAERAAAKRKALYDNAVTSIRQIAASTIQAINGCSNAAEIPGMLTVADMQMNAKYQEIEGMEATQEQVTAAYQFLCDANESMNTAAEAKKNELAEVKEQAQPEVPADMGSILSSSAPPKDGKQILDELNNTADAYKDAVGHEKVAKKTTGLKKVLKVSWTGNGVATNLPDYIMQDPAVIEAMEKAALRHANEHHKQTKELATIPGFEVTTDFVRTGR